MKIDVSNLSYKELNDKIRESDSEVTLENCMGERFIAAGCEDKTINIFGVPGNALGAYLNGATICVNANAQDAVGDTMNDGKIVINGNVGDAAGYAMRGGKMFIKGNAGYRTGIHMKEYKEKVPLMVVGGKAGSFLGEYQAGGVIIVLGLADNDKPIVSNFPCTGMHGGMVILRGDISNVRFPKNVLVNTASQEQLNFIKDKITEYCKVFSFDINEIMDETFTVITPDSKNPYKQMYVAN